MLELKLLNDQVALLRVVWQETGDNSLKTADLETLYLQVKEWVKGLLRVVLVVLEGDMDSSLLDLGLLYHRMNNSNRHSECMDYL